MIGKYIAKTPDKQPVYSFFHTREISSESGLVKRSTICVIRDREGQVISKAEAHCSSNDQFCRATGRYISLKRAFEALPTKRRLLGVDVFDAIIFQLRTKKPIPIYYGNLYPFVSSQKPSYQDLERLASSVMC